jgi:hypothetical protein
VILAEILPATAAVPKKEQETQFALKFATGKECQPAVIHTRSFGCVNDKAEGVVQVQWQSMESFTITTKKYFAT